MKRFHCFYILGICLVFATAAFAQTTVVVNNTPGVKADYSSLQTAVDNVAPGTLILLQPGISSYGQIIIKKRVSIFGAGYFLDQNPAPFTQAAIRSSVIDQVIFDSLSNGSYISGLSVTGTLTSGYSSRFVCRATSNITVSRCLVARLVLPTSFYCDCSHSLGIIFKQCYFQGGGGVRMLRTDLATGIEFHNNIFDGSGTILPVENVTSYTAEVLFKNNTMFSIFNEGSYPSKLTFINNIVFRTVGGSDPIDAVAAMNNIADVSFNNGTNNISNALVNNVLLLNSDPSVISPDGKFRLKTGSQAIGYGQGGLDCGAFGGTADELYALSGIAEAIPNIFFLTVPTVGTATGGLPVHIKVKANN